MGKITSKDLLIVGGFIVVGLAIYLFFFTNIVTGMFGISTATPVVESSDSKLKFDRFNTNVDIKKSEEKTKEELYAEEINQGIQDSLLEEERKNKERMADELIKKAPVNDITELMGNVKKAVKKNEETETPIKPSQQVAAAPTSSYRVAPKKQNPVFVQPNEKEVVELKTVSKKRFIAGSTSAGNMGEEVQTAKGLEKSMINCKALVHNEQSIFNGGPIVFRLLDDMVIGDVTVPRNSFVTGIVNFSTQRAFVLVNSVNVKGIGHSVKLSAFDGKDAVEGLYIPGGTSQDISKDVLNDGVSTVTRKLGVPLLERTLSNAGQRKIAEQSIIFPSGYEVILKNKD
jgi:hypothetical protein